MHVTPCLAFTQAKTDDWEEHGLGQLCAAPVHLQPFGMLCQEDNHSRDCHWEAADEAPGDGICVCILVAVGLACLPAMTYMPADGESDRDVSGGDHNCILNEALLVDIHSST